ncbi:MAG: Asparagine--tRNA ligase [Parcubacteria bacterium OLB19]|nr:MAG: Asparagine--tRNA ligase [Parcubacteria bacterium OLB19]
MKKLPKAFLKLVETDTTSFTTKIENKSIRPPKYDHKTYYKDLTRDEYFDALVFIRHYVKIASDKYFGEVIGAKNTDLFMFTPSISSPMGPGSDSEAVPIKFGKLDTFLVDSSQFGFEPLLFQNLDKVYCYLPSMRGEKPDKRHLNQFYHCEAEILGTLDDLTPIMEGYIRALADTFLAMGSLILKMSNDPNVTEKALRKISNSKSFQKISFENAYDRLYSNKQTRKFTTKTKFGRGINSNGEISLVLEETKDMPLWMYGFDRDTVAFYQKPDPKNTERVINADLLFPPLTRNGFGGEILGSGQRQDSSNEMADSLKRQGISAKPYEWYIDLRNQSGYRTTSGFGLGVERFITWALGYESIQDVALYPRLKNIKTIP